MAWAEKRTDNATPRWGAGPIFTQKVIEDLLHLLTIYLLSRGSSPQTMAGSNSNMIRQNRFFMGIAS